MCQLEKNSAENRVMTQAAKMWKSHVNVTIRRAHSRFGLLWVTTLPAWPANNENSRCAAQLTPFRSASCDAAAPQENSL
jgi:hypothetical protein